MKRAKRLNLISSRAGGAWTRRDLGRQIITTTTIENLPKIFFFFQEAPQSKFPMERRRMIVSGNPTNDQSTTKYKRQLICAQIAAKTVLFHRVKKMGAEAQRQIYVVTYELAKK